MVDRRAPGPGRRRAVVTAPENRPTASPDEAGRSRYLDPARPPQGSWAQRYARTITARGRSVVLLWVLATVLLSAFAPSLGAGGDQLASIIPLDSPALRAEARSVQEFGFPLSSRTAVVQRDPNGMSVFTQAAAVLEAVSADQRPQPYPLLGALPVTNALRVLPGARETGTAVITYLFMDPSSSFAAQRQAGERYIAEHLDHPGDAVVGVAGSVPARAAQASILATSLSTLEVLTILAIVVVVAVNFRAPAPPLVALATAAIAFLITLRLAGLLGELLGLAVPAELEPLLVALMLGVVTDYTVFYVSAVENRVRAGWGWHQAVLDAIASFTPIVLTAGLTVAAGTAALLAAASPFFRAFGPAMAMAVLVALAVSVTLIPALLALLGRAILWPRRSFGAPRTATMPGPGPAGLLPRQGRRSVIRVLTRRPVAAVVLAVGVAVLVLVALPVRTIALGVGFTQSLPFDNPVRAASDAAGQAFSPGITSPTTLLIEGDGVAGQLDALVRFQQEVSRQPGVADVFGPAQLSSVLPIALQVTGTPEGLVLARDGRAARMLVVLDSDPLGARAITTVKALRAAMPSLLADSGLGGVSVSVAGDSALAAGLVGNTASDLWRIGVTAIVVNLLLLVVFLRALVAPLYLLGCSVLALAAALGTQVWVFQHLLGTDGVTFYVPFATAVLLVSLGSDYNIFGVGHVWEEARHRSLREAVVTAVPQSTRAINAAAITLAVSFGLLALVPLRPFREVALTMTVGVLIDALVVRSVLVPCLLVLVGTASGWPGPHFRDVRRRSPSARGSGGSAAPAVEPLALRDDRVAGVRR